MKPDYLGARASNTGDDFHEWWALRKALRLIHPNTQLSAITVEGVNVETNSRGDRGAWDAVDCCHYYGGITIEESERIVVEQLKYSSASPQKNWTVSDFTATTSKNSKKSLVSGLAKSFTRILKLQPNLISTNGLKICLVSNRPVGQDLKKTLEDKSSPKYEVLRKASGLKKAAFIKFTKVLDFSNCGSGSRFQQEEAVIKEIGNLTQTSDRGFVLQLKDRIHSMMLPEGTDKIIDKHTIFSWMNVSDSSALFPCPPKLDEIDNAIPREIVTKITSAILSGEQFICLHGEGGTGKSTLLKQVGESLPEHSAMIVYDCYGAGTYQNSDSLRHRMKDAALQIVNECSARLGVPLLVGNDSSIDYLKAMKLRLEDASALIRAKSCSAQLLIVIDAADNSIIAAEQCKPIDVSFVENLVKLGSLPLNTCLIISTRTGRLKSLHIPGKFCSIQIPPFAISETTELVTQVYPEISSEWIEDFHHLSNQNPRVQGYALKYGGLDHNQALEYLRPHGKSLEDIFNQRFMEATAKQGDLGVLQETCSALIALPRPIPKEHLSEVLNISTAQLSDIVLDLPGMRVLDSEVGFQDEDVEAYVRECADERLPEMLRRVASHLLTKHEHNEYAAIHLAHALFEADWGEKILKILSEFPNPTAIKDEIVRREVQSQRLLLSMAVCRSSGTPVDAVFTLLVGTEARKTEEAADQILVDNPDLSVQFAGDSINRKILYATDRYEYHGRFLSYLLEKDALKKDFIGARERRRVLRAWLENRNEHFKDNTSGSSKRFREDLWPLETEDIAAIANAVRIVDGIEAAYDFVVRWRPKSLHFQVGLVLIKNLVAKGDFGEVNDILKSNCLSQDDSGLYNIPLALAGQEIDLNDLFNALKPRRIRRLVKLVSRRNKTRHQTRASEFLELILTGCEILLHNGYRDKGILKLLEPLCNEDQRGVTNVNEEASFQNDIAFKAYCLSSLLAKSEPTFESYLIALSTEDSESEIYKRSEKKRARLLENLTKLFNVYVSRAKAVLLQTPSNESCKKIESALGSFLSDSWRHSREYRLMSLSDYLALSISKLTFLKTIDTEKILGLVKASYKDWNESLFLGQRKVICQLITNTDLKPILTSEICNSSSKVLKLKAPASEKIEILISWSRALVAVDPSEAQAIFNLAIDLANDVDVEAMNEVTLFYSLANRSHNYLSQADAAKLALDMASVTEEYGTRLLGYDNFPWNDSIKALATLDLATAIRVSGLWADYQLRDFDACIQSIISVGIPAETITLAQGTSLFVYSDYLETETIATLSNHSDAANNINFTEEVARRELLVQVGKKRQEVASLLRENSSNIANTLYWLPQLEKTIELESLNKRPPESAISSDRQKKSDTFWKSINIKDISIQTAEELITSFSELKQQASRSNIYLADASIVELLTDNNSILNKVNFANLLCDESVIEFIGHGWAKFLMDSVDMWAPDSIAITSWKKNELPIHIAQNIDLFTYDFDYGYDKPLLVETLDDLNLNAEHITNILLDGFEKHSESLPLSTIYQLIAVLVNYCPESDIADLSLRYLQRLSGRLELQHNPDYSSARFEGDSSEALAKLTFSLLGDLNVSVRWRAAHSVRSRVRMGDREILQSLSELWPLREVSGYRESTSPFYWIAARLWLVITLERISTEKPTALLPISRWLIKIAHDEKFPHVLIRHFVKSCLENLILCGVGDFDKGEIKRIKEINQSKIGTLVQNREDKYRGDRGFNNDEGTRRFRFDALDTLRYTYPRATECFSKPDNEEFLVETESWIIDKWGVSGDYSGYHFEPRKTYFKNVDFRSYSQSHGARPQIEKYRYYLEWHGMWCSIGSLMEKNALAAPEYDDSNYGTLEGFIEGHALRHPPHWSSDVRSCAPLENRFHGVGYPNVTEWDEHCVQADFDTVLQLNQGDEFLTIDSNTRTLSKDLSVRSKINSCLVSSYAATSLLRTFQASADPDDYFLPPAGNDAEIDSGRFQLRGWVEWVDGDRGIDEHDPFCYGVSRVGSKPSKNIIESSNLFERQNIPMTWHRDDNARSPTFRYETWSDHDQNSTRELQLFENEILSEGERLQVSNSELITILKQQEMELMVKIVLSARGAEYGKTDYNQEPENYARRTKFYLLKRNGEYITSEGCVGTWALPS
ncbi:MAG: hypothetical protein ACI9SP_004370 [Arenicella sp.]|jgi:hypothetical protein